MASAGGAITGPISGLEAHPEWQGSVPSKWFDRGSGYQRGKPLQHSDILDGYNGVARRGFGAFAADASFRCYEESLRRTKQFPEQYRDVAPWGDHPQEFRWQPSRRKLEDHEFEWRVGPKTSHAGLLAHVAEPDLLSKRPAFIDKKGTKALPDFDPEVDRAKQKAMNKQLFKKFKAAAAEDQWERDQVLGLEAWERSHVPKSLPVHRSPALAATSSLITLGKSAQGATGTRKMQQRASSMSGLQFTRQRL